MTDKLHDLFDEWKKKAAVASDSPILFNAFQGGFTAAAVSMRERAMKVVDDCRDPNNDAVLNTVKNGIGSLSDIP